MQSFPPFSLAKRACHARVKAIILVIMMHLMANLSIGYNPPQVSKHSQAINSTDHAIQSIEKYKKRIHWEVVYDDVYDANEAAREMMLQFTGEFDTDKNAGSRTKPYSGSAGLIPWFYNDPLSVSVKVIEAASVQQVLGRKRPRVE